MALAKSRGVGAAVALHHDAVQAQQRRRRCGAGSIRSRHRAAAPAGPAGRPAWPCRLEVKRRLQLGGDEPGHALGGLQRDIAGEAVGDDHVDRALGDVVALDEAVVVQVEAGPRAGCGAPRGPPRGPSCPRSRR